MLDTVGIQLERLSKDAPKQNTTLLAIYYRPDLGMEGPRLVQIRLARRGKFDSVVYHLADGLGNVVRITDLVGVYSLPPMLDI